MGVSFYTNNAYQGYPKLQNDINDVKQSVGSVDSLDEKVEKSALGIFPTFRRVMSLPDKVEKGDTVGAIGVSAVAVTLLPEDLRDVRNAWNQVSAKIQGKPYKAPYLHEKFQHDWSFFKGSLVDEWVKRLKDPKVKQKAFELYGKDKSLYNTKFGKTVRNFLSINDGLPEKAGILKDKFGKQMYVSEIKAKNLFGELTGRAMKRTTKIGALLLAAFELPKIFKAMNQGDGVAEQAGNTVKQTAKSAVNVTSVLAGIGYCGAYGAKRFGAFGSLAGMAIGAVAGATVSNKVQELIG